MQEYLRRSRLAEVLDAVGLHFFGIFLCLGWFLLLWGPRLPVIPAGLALFLLLLLCRQKRRDVRLQKREKALRQRIGGELALERLLLVSPQKAHFELALLLSEKHPIALEKTGEKGVLCQMKGEKVLILFAQCPRMLPLSPEKVLLAQQEIMQEKAVRGILGSPCALSDGAREQAALDPKLTLLPPEKLIPLFGAANPATDAQLSALRNRKQARSPGKSWLSRMLKRSLAPRYGLYAALLLGLYLLTGAPSYALSGLFCALLSAFSHCQPREKDAL